MGVSALTLGLSARNVQDVPLTCSPEMTFFKQRTPRYTNFQTGQITQALGSGGNSALIGSGSSKVRGLQTVLQRTADLMGPTYIQTVLPALNTRALVNNVNVAAVTAADLSMTVSLNGGTTVTGTTTDAPLIAAAGDGLSYVSEVGHYLLQHCEINIGSQCMDEVYDYSQYLEWHARKADENLLENSLGMGGWMTLINRAYHAQVMYTPIGLWYTRAPSMYLPTISCQGHDIVFKMDGVSANDLWGGHGGLARTEAVADPTGTTDLGLPVGQAAVITDHIATKSAQQLVYDGVFLDRAERVMFAKMAQEYLMDQYQYITSGSVTAGTSSVSLKNISFNHPMRHMAVALRRRDYVTPYTSGPTVPADGITPYQDSVGLGAYKTPIRWNDFSAGPQLSTGERLTPMTDLQLKINNYDRFADLKLDIGGMYNEVQPGQKAPGKVYDTFGMFYFFGQYGFGACPSGTLNFSAIDNVEINIARAINPMSDLVVTASVPARPTIVDYPAADVLLYGCGTNILKFVSGMAGKAYAS